MLVMTARVDMKKIAIILAAIVVLIAGLMMLFGGDSTQPTASPSLASNEGRVQFLTNLGWDVVVSPTQTSQVKIPEKSGDIFDRYNALQKSQGYDLSKFAGKTVMRYVYEIKNYPDATDPVYATLLIYKDQIIGGDVTDTSANGAIRGFKMPSSNPQATLPSTIPSAA